MAGSVLYTAVLRTFASLRFYCGKTYCCRFGSNTQQLID